MTWNTSLKQWEVPESYEVPADAQVIIWPSSLPTSFAGISPQLHERLKTVQSWTEAGLRDHLDAQHLLNRVVDADCLITCWTEIPDAVLDRINPKAILTWTHEFEHRLNVKKAQDKGIYTNSVPDYGTDAVAELEFDGLQKLIARNHATDDPAATPDDVLLGVLEALFKFYRKSHINERNTRRGKFSHQFHKLGRSQNHYAGFGDRTLDEIIPERLIEGKTIGIVGEGIAFDHLEYVLKQGFRMHVRRLQTSDLGAAEFYQFVAESEFVVLGRDVQDELRYKMAHLKSSEQVIHVAELKHYDQTLQGRVIGIVGLGRIGRRVAQIADAIGMTVCYSGPSKQDVPYRHVELDELLQAADIVSLNVPAHIAHGLISAAHLRTMKPGAYFLNTSDGNAVDQLALIDAMQANRIYAALDVYQGLPTTGALGLDDDPAGHIGQALGNHVIWYRAGWKTQESIRVKTYKLLGRMLEAGQPREVSGTP